jgi:hypothetical protein
MGPPPARERRSNSMRVTGIVLLSVGGLLSVAGATLFITGTTCVHEDLVFPGERTALPPEPVPAPEPTPDGGQSGQERIGSGQQALNACDALATPGAGLFVGGLATAIAGIPLLVIGSKQVPAKSRREALLPEVTVGAASGSLRWTF